MEGSHDYSRIVQLQFLLLSMLLVCMSVSTEKDAVFWVSWAALHRRFDPCPEDRPEPALIHSNRGTAGALFRSLPLDLTPGSRRHS